MKPKSVILAWLGSCLAGLGLFEWYTQSLWRLRYMFPSVDFDAFAESALKSASLMPLRVVSNDKDFIMPELSGFSTELFNFDSFGDYDLSGVFSACCFSESETKCISGLKQFSQQVFDSFYVFVCGNDKIIHYDQLLVVSRLDSERISIWPLEPLKFSGPFRFGNPLIVLRLFFVNGGYNKLNEDLSLFTRRLFPSFEIIADPTVVYNGRIEPLLSKNGNIVDINEELAVWEGSGHQLSFGTYTMPPLSRIAKYVDDSTNFQETIEIPDWGVIYGTDGNPISILRYWLSLSLECEFCIDGLSQTEKLLISKTAKISFIETLFSNLKKLANKLHTLPKLWFEEHQLLNKILNIFLHAEFPTAKNLSIATLESFELLNSEKNSPPAHFSWEFTFALYAPLFLPMGLPVIMSIYRARRSTRVKKD